MRRDRNVLHLIKATFASWGEDRAPKMVAALAYYTAFAVGPLLLIAIGVAGLLFGPDAARGAVVGQIEGLIGREGAQSIQDLLARAWQPKTSLLATIVGAVALLVAASGVFGELQDSLNTIWKVRKRRDRGILGTLKDRLLSFSAVLGVGFLLLVSLVLSAGLDALGGLLTTTTGGGVAIRVASFLASLAIVSAVFALMFRFLPDARTRWREVAFGALVTGVLFTAGKLLIGLYLGKSTLGTTYGAAGAFVVFLVWVNYSAQIVFLGAEFTRTYAERIGTPPVPDEDAEELAAPPGRPVRRGRFRRSRRAAALRR